MNRNPNPKLHQHNGAENPAAFNASDNSEVTNAAEPQDLAQLVWKYFENDIRETMIEVQDEIQAQKDGPADQTRQRKQKRK